MKVPSNANYSYYELILTEDCNLRCKYCFDDYFSDRTGCSYDTSMSIDILDDLFNFIYNTKAKDSRNPIKISFFGGEPFSNFKFMKAFVEKAEKEFNFPIRYSINTNGYNLNSEKIDFLVDNNISIAVSIDGNQKSHDFNRITVGGGNSWKNIMKSMPELLAKVRGRGGNVTFMYTITEETIDELYDSYHFFANMGVNISLQFETEKKKSNEFHKKFEDTMRKLYVEEYMPWGSAFKDWIMNPNKHKANSFCFLPEQSISIAPDGHLYFCHRLAPKMSEDIDIKGKISYGNIKDGITNEKFYELMQKRTDFNSFKENTGCKTCEAAYWCKGGCLASHWNDSNMSDINHLNPELCKINKMLTRIAKEIIERDRKNQII